MWQKGGILYNGRRKNVEFLFMEGREIWVRCELPRDGAVGMDKYGRNYNVQGPVFTTYLLAPDGRNMLIKQKRVELLPEFKEDSEVKLLPYEVWTKEYNKYA